MTPRGRSKGLTLHTAEFAEIKDLGTFGVESVEIRNKWLSYLNTGETYDLTVCYWCGRFIVASWGDIAE